MCPPYPSALDNLPTDMTGTTLFTNPTDDHALSHRNLGSAVNALETTLGTTGGISVLKNFTASDFPARINAGGTLQQSIVGTIGMTAGTINFSGQGTNSGTLANGVYGTATYQGGTANNLTLGTPIMQAWNGWNTLVGTLTYLATDGHIFTVTTNADFTGVMGTGDRVQISQSGNKNFIIHAINSGTITLYGGTAYSISAGTFTNPLYSHVKSPLNFPTIPTYWQEGTTLSSDVDQGTVTAGQLYNPGTVTIVAPIGAWKAKYDLPAEILYTAGAGQMGVTAALSTGTASVSDTNLQSYAQTTLSSGQVVNNSFWLSREEIISVAAKTSYYLIGASDGTSGATTLRFNGLKAPIIITLTDAYL